MFNRLFDRSFFGTKLGQAALVSIGAMATFAILTTMHGATLGDVTHVAMPATGLA